VSPESRIKIAVIGAGRVGQALGAGNRDPLRLRCRARSPAKSEKNK